MNRSVNQSELLKFSTSINCGPQKNPSIPHNAALRETYWSRIGNNVQKLFPVVWDFVPQAHYRSFALGPLVSEM